MGGTRFAVGRFAVRAASRICATTPIPAGPRIKTQLPTDARIELVAAADETFFRQEWAAIDELFSQLWSSKVLALSGCLMAAGSSVQINPTLNLCLYNRKCRGWWWYRRDAARGRESRKRCPGAIQGA